MKRIVPLLMALSLAACASNPGEYDKVYDVAGSTPGNYQAAIKSYMGTKLKDPYSAKYTFSKPQLVTCKPNVFLSGQAKLWKVAGTVNAKNSFGAYIGSKPYYFWVSKGRAIGAEEPNPVYPNWCSIDIEEWNKIKAAK